MHHSLSLLTSLPFTLHFSHSTLLPVPPPPLPSFNPLLLPFIISIHLIFCPSPCPLSLYCYLLIPLRASGPAMTAIRLDKTWASYRCTVSRRPSQPDAQQLHRLQASVQQMCFLHSTLSEQTVHLCTSLSLRQNLLACHYIYYLLAEMCLDIHRYLKASNHDYCHHL